MIWSPSSPATPASMTPASAVFRIQDRNYGGVAWVVNTDEAASQSFTIGPNGVDNAAPKVHLGPGQGIFIAFGNEDTNISASVAAAVFITPGIARP